MKIVPIDIITLIGRSKVVEIAKGCGVHYALEGSIDTRYCSPGIVFRTIILFNVYVACTDGRIAAGNAAPVPGKSGR